VAEPYALFGHSTGALCAFEVVRQLRAVGGVLPVHLFVSGRRPPQLAMERLDIGALTPPELATLLRRMGGTPEELLADHEVLSALQPLLAADFAVNQHYDYVSGLPLELPLTAFAGVEDPGADVEWMAPWKDQTTGDFTLYELDGGHFAVFAHRAQVHAYITAHLAAYLTGRG
jgi:medium-chain acyl-[acyl-carrier-protein] hydrolase